MERTTVKLGNFKIELECVDDRRLRVTVRGLNGYLPVATKLLSSNPNECIAKFFGRTEQSSTSSTSNTSIEPITFFEE